MSEITIVTAFFNIKREEWGSFSRSADKYLSYFEFWARINNKVIVYVDSKEIAEKVITIRRNYGLEDKTIINIINDFREIDAELYISIKNATENNIQRSFRLKPQSPESWNTDYNYIMLLKEWFVKDAVDKKIASGTIAWLDFGFNHGGALYNKETDFDFLWNYDFGEYINIFAIKELDDRPIFDIIRTMDTYIMGGIIVGPDYLWDNFWQLMRNSMISLNRCGLVDDDQSIILMSYRTKSDIFKVRMSTWLLPMKEYGGGHLSIREDNCGIRNSKTIRFIKNIVRWFRKTKRNVKYSVREFKAVQRINI